MPDLPGGHAHKATSRHADLRVRGPRRNTGMPWSPRGRVRTAARRRFKCSATDEASETNSIRGRVLLAQPSFYRSGQCCSGYHGEARQSRVSFARTGKQFFGDFLSQSMIAAVRQCSTHVLQDHIQIGSGPIVEPFHLRCSLKNLDPKSSIAPRQAQARNGTRGAGLPRGTAADVQGDIGTDSDRQFSEGPPFRNCEARARKSH
jgi:hypothetical protein